MCVYCVGGRGGGGGGKTNIYEIFGPSQADVFDAIIVFFVHISSSFINYDHQIYILK